MALFACSSISIATTLGIVGILIWETYAFFSEVSFQQFFGDTEWTPLFANQHFGIWPLICGTALTTAIAMAVALPIGLISSIYLSQFAATRTRAIIKPILEVFAGIPTVVYGFFALLFVTPLLQKFIPGLAGFNALSPGLVMGVMILPMVTSLSEDAMFSVPPSLQEAALALGANRFSTAWRVVVPGAISGITASILLSTSRAIGETMIVAIAAGQQARLSLNPLSPLETMTAYIVQVSLGDTPAGTIEFKTIFAVAMMLFLITLIFNLFGFYLRNKLKEQYE